MEYYEKGYDLAKKTGDINLISWLGTSLAQGYVGAGNMNKAIPLSEESVALDRKTGNLTHLSMSLAELGTEYLILGEWDKSEKCLKEALNNAQGLKDIQAVDVSYWSLANFYRDMCEYAKAKELLEKGYEVYKKAGSEIGQWWYSHWINDTCIELGEIEEALSQIDNLYNSAPEVEAKTRNKYTTACAKRLKAKLLRRQGKWEESIEYFEKSLQDFEALNAKRWNVYYYAKWVLSEYAQVYLERDQEGDKEKARDLLNQALETFQKMGAKKDIEKTMRLVEALQPPLVQTRKKAVGAESRECAEVQSKIIATPEELKIGESLELVIEVTNPNKKGAILLLKIIEVVPEGFAVAKKSELYRMEGNCINMKEKRLGPSKTEEVKLVLMPRIQGTFQIKARILYVDANGKEETHEPKPISITVKELGIKGWLKGER
jgi:tetratricopeptide (TPR) repeat protein